MLLYHPSKDTNHASYRIISILENIENNELPKQMVHLIGFYYLFPSQLQEIDKWPRKNTSSYKVIHSLSKEYELMENPQRVFFEIKELQENAINFLIYNKILEYNNDKIKLIKENIPYKLYQMLNNDIFRKESLFNIMTKEISKFNLKGSNGMKMKTKLMEYIYD